MTTSRKEQSISPVERSFDWLAATLFVIGAGHFLSAMSPSVWTWGLDYWSDLPLWGRSLLLLSVALVMLPGVPERVAGLFEKKRWPQFSSWAAAGAAFVGFLIFRSHGYAYGDGYSIRSYITGGLPDLSGNLALMAGDLVAHWVVFRAAVLPLGGSAEFAYALLSAVAGVASLAAIARIARQMYPKDRGARWTIVAAGFSSGMAALWFGHVEAYSLVGASLLWSIALLIMGKRGWAWGMWILACVFHLLAVAFLPVLLSSLWEKRPRETFRRKAILVVLFAGFIAWGIAAAVFSIVRPGIFVPLLSTPDSTYSAFSIAHLSDTVNLLLFVAPLGLLGLVMWLFRRDVSWTSDEGSILAILAVSSASLWYFSFWVDPLIGAFRDWDLIGVYGIPLSLLGAMVLLGPRAGTRTGRPQWVMVAVFAIAHTAAFALTAQDEMKVVDRVNRLVREDAHYSHDFHRGERLVSWSHILTQVIDKKEMAIEHLLSRASWEPNDRNSWNNLGSLYWRLGRIEEAAVSLEKSLDLYPDDTLILEELSLCYSRLERWDTSGGVIERLAGLRELKVSELNLLGYSYFTKNQDAKAESVLALSLSRQPDQREAHYYLGLIAERQRDTTKALEKFGMAMTPSSELEDPYLRSVKLHQDRLEWAEVERVATAWQMQFPRSPMAPLFVGIAKIAAGEYRSARDAFDRVLALSPNNALAHFYLATVYRNLNDPDRARAEAMRAAQIDSTLAPPYLELVYLAADAGDRAGAVSATREYLRRSPGDSGMTYLQQFMDP